MNTETVKERVAEMHGNVKKIYGPYVRRDKRKVAIIIFNDGSRRTVSWPKAIYEAHHGKFLDDDMTIDHINGDFTDDSLDNLQAMSRVDNIKKGFEQGFLKPAGSFPGGENNPASVMNEAAVKEIRRKYKNRSGRYDRKISYKSLARKYSVNKNTIMSIINRQTWSHVPGD